MPVPGDAASEEGVAALIGAARAELGEIDLYCANAGIVRGGGPETAEPDWDASWQVNVMAHVRAARLLLGPWLERGSGHLICTVSAAGLLTMPGTAPYSVTKHAALAFAEWLAVTYAHRGLTVQAICPLGVRTAMLDGSDRAGREAARRRRDPARGGRGRGHRGHRGRPVPDPAAPRGGGHVRGPGGRDRPLAARHEQAAAAA